MGVRRTRVQIRNIVDEFVGFESYIKHTSPCKSRRSKTSSPEKSREVLPSQTSPEDQDKIKKSRILDSGDLKIQLLEGVTFLYKFFIKSVISGSKCPRPKIPQICACLLVLSLCLLMISLCLHAQPVPTPQKEEGVLSLYKFFTKLVISGSQRPKIEKSGILNSWNPGSRAQPSKSNFRKLQFSFVNSLQNRSYLVGNGQKSKNLEL